MSDSTSPSPLWTRDFTIITLGSVVSMFGNAMSGFAMSLMVLDISETTFHYSIYIAMFTLSQLIMPVFSGALLDRFSRKKTIYSLDFFSAFLFFVMAGILHTGWFSFPVFALYCFILGSVESAYMVAYESFYPLLISEGNFQKAYSIASVLETLSAVMVPVSTFLYGLVGIAPLLFINGICFLIAAIMETRIEARENYIEDQKKTRLKEQGPVRQMLTDTREGFLYLAAEKGLLAIAVYFAFSAVCGGVSSVIVLPYFKRTFANGEYWFGTNGIGQDYWAQVWYATRASIVLAVLVSIGQIALGVVIGLIWGYVRKLDRFFTELYNLIDNIPTIIYMTLIALMVGKSMLTMGIAMVGFGWLGTARNVRNLVFMYRDREYNLASRCLGTRLGRILFRNIFPYLVSVIILRLALAIPGTIAYETTLTYLGLMDIMVPSLGNLLSAARAIFPRASYTLWFPAAIVSITTITFYLVGNAFSDACDPRNHV